MPDSSAERKAKPFSRDGRSPSPRAGVLRFAGGKLSQMLHRAVEEKQIRPVFQPLLDLPTRRITGFEILARWYVPGHGHIPPDEFIPVADAEDLLTQLTEQLLGQACAAAAAWPDHLTLAVNISPRQLEDPTLPQRIAEIAAQHRFPPARLEIEITEQALLGPLETVRATVAELKSLGSAIVMDDFGVGHASLSRLKQLPFDKIKIDRSFVDSLEDGPEGKKIIAAIIGLGLSLGVTTVAEGVEDQEQAHMLARLGCAVSQGFLFGRPVPEEEVPELLRAAALPADSAVSTGERRLLRAEGAATGQGLPPTELAPAERLAQLEALVTVAPVGLALCDPALRCVTVNPAFARACGLPLSAFVGRTLPDVLPFDAAQILPHLERALAAGTAVECEVKIGDAGRIYLQTAQPVHDASGTITGLAVALLDMTDQRLAEDAFLDSEENLRHTVALNPHMPWTSDPSGRVLTLDPRWLTLTGATAKDVREQGWTCCVHPDDVQGFSHRWADAVQTGEPHDAIFRMLCRRDASAEGETAWRWVRSRALPRRDAQGKILRWYGTLEDIHERKLMELALPPKAREAG